MKGADRRKRNAKLGRDLAKIGMGTELADLFESIDDLEERLEDGGSSKAPNKRANKKLVKVVTGKRPTKAAAPPSDDSDSGSDVGPGSDSDDGGSSDDDDGDGAEGLGSLSDVSGSDDDDDESGSEDEGGSGSGSGSEDGSEDGSGDSDDDGDAAAGDGSDGGSEDDEEPGAGDDGSALQALLREKRTGTAWVSAKRAEAMAKAAEAAERRAAKQAIMYGGDVGDSEEAKAARQRIMHVDESNPE
jgi:hypothetical protein